MNVPLLRKTHDGHRSHDNGQGIGRSDDHPARTPTPMHDRPRRGQLRRGWDPAAEFDDLYDRIDRLRRELFWPAAADASWPLAGWSPPADVEETTDAYLVEIELPGVKRDDVSIELNSGELLVSGEIKERERRGFWRSRTRRVGQFDYRVSLPAGVDPDQVDASLNQGILTIRIAKTEQAKRRKIAITAPEPEPTRNPTG